MKKMGLGGLSSGTLQGEKDDGILYLAVESSLRKETVSARIQIH